MMLIGQYDSPFVRRVAIAMHLYGIAYDHQPWSTFGNAELIAPFNPLRRVPVLVLDEGEALIESSAILDYLDERAGPSAAMLPASGMDRRKALRVCALATGLADKSVGLLYEKLLHAEKSAIWLARCETQIAGVLTALEAERVSRTGAFWFGERIGHADIAVACALRFTREAHQPPEMETRWPALTAHAARCEALPVFRDVVQVLSPPA
jgi:glutathione S-transferase